MYPYPILNFSPLKSIILAPRITHKNLKKFECRKPSPKKTKQFLPITPLQGKLLCYKCEWERLVYGGNLHIAKLPNKVLDYFCILS